MRKSLRPGVVTQVLRRNRKTVAVGCKTFTPVASGSFCSGAATSLTSEEAHESRGHPQVKQNQIGLEGIDAFWLKTISDYVGRWKTIVRRWHDPGGIQGDGKHSQLESLIIVNYERAGAVPTGIL